VVDGHINRWENRLWRATSRHRDRLVAHTRSLETRV
jgi:hypothetical protein